jgi:hypothetical protein
MLWSFSRDGGVPLHRVWAAVNYRTRTPVNATWAMSALAFLLGLPILFSQTAFLAMASICFIGLYASCALYPPIPFFKCISMVADTQDYLWSKLVHIVAWSGGTVL